MLHVVSGIILDIDTLVGIVSVTNNKPSCIKNNIEPVLLKNTDKPATNKPIPYIPSVFIVTANIINISNEICTFHTNLDKITSTNITAVSNTKEAINLPNSKN